MVGLGGLEPPTSPLSGVHSNQLSYSPIKLQNTGYKKRFKTIVCISTQFFVIYMVENSGIEPLTSCVQNRRSPS